MHGEQYDAMIMVDESHSAGVVGDTGRGVTERYNLRGKVEIITGTLGKAFGGAIGGFTTGKKKSLTCCVSVRARICFPTRFRRWSLPQACVRLK